MFLDNVIENVFFHASWQVIDLFTIGEVNSCNNNSWAYLLLKLINKTFWYTKSLRSTELINYTQKQFVDIELIAISRGQLNNDNS